MLMTNVRTTILAALLLTLLVSQGCQTGFFGKITGNVSEVINGTPLKDATITIEDTKYITVTDAQGNFTFNSIPTGIYTLRASKLNDEYQEIVLYNAKLLADSVLHLNLIAELKQNAIIVSPKDTIKLSSLKPGCLLLRGKHGFAVDPKSPNTNIIAIRNAEKHILSRITGVKPYVKIEKPEQGLEVVRLFTDLSTYYLLTEPNPDNIMIEVTSSTAKKLAPGEMPMAYYKKLGLFEPRVSADDHGITIERYLVSFSHNLYRVKEHVTFDGECKIVSKILILPHMEIALPMTGNNI